MAELQSAWFLLIGVLLVGYAILDGFDLGVGMLHLFVAKNDHERRTLLNSIGPVWDGNEVWLLTAGGAIFAAFPPVYATVFSGFYLALMLLLVALIVRAVSLEFRSKEESPTWRATWDTIFAVGSFLPSLLFGVAIGNIVRGVPLAADGEFAGTFLGLLNPFSILVGLLSVAMFLMQGSSWLLIRTDGEVRARVQKTAVWSWAAFVVLWCATTVAAWFAAPTFWDRYRSLATWAAPLALIVASIGYFLAIRRDLAKWAFGWSSVAIASLLGILGQGLYPRMVPSLDPAMQSLTIFNSSSSLYTLTVMLIIALVGMPVVIGYTLFIYRKFFTTVVLDEHSY